jgi:hypothetical protein
MHEHKGQRRDDPEDDDGLQNPADEETGHFGRSFAKEQDLFNGEPGRLQPPTFVSNTAIPSVLLLFPSAIYGSQGVEF